MTSRSAAARRRAGVGPFLPFVNLRLFGGCDRASLSPSSKGLSLRQGWTSYHGAPTGRSSGEVKSWRERAGALFPSVSPIRKRRADSERLESAQLQGPARTGADRPMESAASASVRKPVAFRRRDGRWRRSGGRRSARGRVRRRDGRSCRRCTPAPKSGLWPASRRA